MSSLRTLISFLRPIPSASRSLQFSTRVTTSYEIQRRSIVTPVTEPAVVNIGDVYAGKYEVGKLLGTGTRSSI